MLQTRDYYTAQWIKTRPQHRELHALQLDCIPRAVYKDWDDSIPIYILVTLGCVLLERVERFINFLFLRDKHSAVY